VPDLATVSVAFSTLLRGSGVPVTTEQTSRFAAAVGLARPWAVAEVYWLGRVTLLSSPAQIAAYDVAFDQVFRGLADVADFRGDAPPAPRAPSPSAALRPGPDRRPSTGRAPETDLPAPGDVPDRPGTDPAEDDPVLVAAAREEHLRQRHFASCTPEELQQISELVSRLRLGTPLRPARRRTAHRSGRRLDLRRTLRAAHRTGGDPTRRVYRVPTSRPRRVVLLADVSGSMEPYSRVYLHLLHGAVRATRAEAFVFATRLTRLTRPLGLDHPDVALARATRSAPDWSGGTRIGEAVKSFLDDFGRRGLARGAVVVVVSDGWERDDAALLAEQMARLARLAHRVVWVNPRSAVPGFAPRAAGMAAALPHVDTLVSGHSVHALDEVLAAISPATARVTPGRRGLTPGTAGPTDTGTGRGRRGRPG